jgi:ABC-type Fe3+-hydroxamate transport system substrate-binding protein
MFCQITDQLDRVIALDDLPLRIISLVPSQTELLVDLGLKDRLVGITRYCIHPKELIDEVEVVGGTKKIVQSRIIEAQPDLIICNKEENTQDIVSFCDTVAPVYVSDVSTLENALDMIRDVGVLTGASFKAKSLARNIGQAFKQLSKPDQIKRALYLIWKEPYMAVGGDTFINDMLEKAGFDNVCKEMERYPEFTMDQMVELQPDVIFLSTEPYPFKASDKKLFYQPFLMAPSINPVKPNIDPKVIVADGEMFSWYGSRLLQAPAYFKKLLTATDTSS